MVDPWEASKLESLEAALPAFVKVCEENPSPSFENLVLCCLWGNRSDLSLSSGSVDSKVATGAAGKLLIDHVHDVAKHLEGKPAGSEIVMILDNCGAELLADLRLAVYLSKRFSVTLHVKAHPVFVSDALVKNVEQHVARLEKAKVPLAAELRDRLAKGSLRVLADEFYVSPLEFPRAPMHLKDIYARTALVIVKGDANYRRILLDRYFPHDFPFSALCQATTRAPIFAIRTCKSPVVVGLPRSVEDAVAAADANWCVNGSCGTLQFSHAMETKM